MPRLDLSLTRKKSKCSEEEALQSILKSKGLTPEQLTPAHKEKVWCWVANGVTTNANPTANAADETVKVSKADFPDRDAAERHAYPQLNTFQGNLKLVEQDDENWTFGKVRG